MPAFEQMDTLVQTRLERSATKRLTDRLEYRSEIPPFPAFRSQRSREERRKEAGTGTGQARGSYVLHTVDRPKRLKSALATA